MDKVDNAYDAIRNSPDDIARISQNTGMPEWKWLYEEGVHVGFYDLKADKDTTIGEILELEGNKF